VTDLSVVDLDRAAVGATVELLREATTEDWARPTPCGDWNLAELVAHMTVQHHGFAAASEGAADDLAIWQPVVADDPFAAYQEGAERVVAAFAVPGVLERTFRLPELSTEIAFPAAQAIGFHYLDYVVHAWDVARTLDVPVPLGEDVIGPVLPIAERVPTGERRLQPGAAFRPAVDDGGSTDTLDRIVALLGRDPGWKAD
jgi:uncharacterized protein (TIGR03086 family)